MITLIAEILVKEGFLNSMLERFQNLQKTVLEEEGCYQYTPLTDFLPKVKDQTLAKNTLFMFERWESHAHLDAHRKTPHMLRHDEETKNQVESVVLRILEDHTVI